MTDAHGVAADTDATGVSVVFRFELGRADWTDAFRGVCRMRGLKGRVKALYVPVLIGVAAWLLADSPWAGLTVFVGGVLGLFARTRALAARQARTGAALGAWTVTVADTDEGVRFSCTDMETRRGWGSFGGYVETADGFILLTPAPYLLVVHYLPKRALGLDGVKGVRAVLARRLPHRGAPAPRH